MQIVVKKAFKHCVLGAIYPTAFHPSPMGVEVDEETATIAVREGWAIPVDPTTPAVEQETGRLSRSSGPVPPSSVSPAAPVSRGSKSKGFKGKPR